jgi:thiamine phosphate synthase YjbQ (UPF0047 family)
MSVLTVQSKAHEQVVDITADVAALAASMGDGVCSLFTPHTTCALTVLTNEEGIAEDFLSGVRPRLGRPRPRSRAQRAARAVRSVPVRDRRLGLGQFQHIVLVEFEGPRQRTIEVTASAMLYSTPTRPGGLA